MKNKKLSGLKEALILPILLVVVPTTFVGFLASGSSNIIDMLLGLVLIILAGVSANVLNNYSDWEIDIKNKKRNILHETFKRRELSFLYLFILLLIYLIVYIFRLNFYTLLTISLYILMGIFYSLFIRFKDKILFNYLIIAISYGVIAFSLGYFLGSNIISGFYNLLPIIIFIFIADFGYSISKDYGDIIGDKKYKKNTLPVIFGKDFSIKFQFLIINIAYIFLLITISLNKLSYLYLFLFISYLFAMYIIKKTKNTNNINILNKMHFLAQINGLSIRFILILLLLIKFL